MNKIYLNDILNISEDKFKDFTICLNNPFNISSHEANNNEDLMNIMSWKKSVGAKQSFRILDTKYCLQFIRLDILKQYDYWLFIGAFEVGHYEPNLNGHELYKLTQSEFFEKYNERLVIKYKKHSGDKQAKLKIANLKTLEVVQIFDKKFDSVNKHFPGYDNLSLSFSELSSIINGNVLNWKNNLLNVNGVYCITDTNTGKLYIGSTYNKNGVWGRWEQYVNSKGSGGNEQLISLIQNEPNYAFKHFKFTLLEVFLNTPTGDKHIQNREYYYMKVFNTTKTGYNHGSKAEVDKL